MNGIEKEEFEVDEQEQWPLSIPETQEEDDDTPLFENVSPQPKLNNERESYHQLYYIDPTEFDDFQNNPQSNQLSPTIDNESPIGVSPLGQSNLFSVRQENFSPERNLVVGTSLPSFIRKKLPKEEQEKFANTRLLMFHRDYFFAVMDEDNDDLNNIVSTNKAVSSTGCEKLSSIKRVRSHLPSSDDEESIDSECDLYIDEAETYESEEYIQIENKRNKRRNTSSKDSSNIEPILVHFFGDETTGNFLTSTIIAPCRTKTGAKAIKPNAYVNKRTTIKQTDKTLQLIVNNPHGYLERDEFEVFIIVEMSSHGEDLELRDQLDDAIVNVKKLVTDPEEEYLLDIVEENKTEDGWELSCQVSTSNNFGWKSKHKYYKFLVVSHVEGVSSCVSEEFRVSQNVSC